jgi:hypothetical protein
MAQPAAGRVIHLPAHAALTLLKDLDRATVALSAELTAADAPMPTVYDLCRSLEKAFAGELHRSGRHIIDCLSSLAPALSHLPSPSFWDLDHVERVCARSDGIQPFLVSPEAGLRALIRDAVEAFRKPAQDCLARVHATLQRIWEAAVADGLAQADGARRSRKCEAVLGAAVESALSGWLASASQGVDMLVSMEQGFISAEFFRARASVAATSDAWEKSSAGNESASGADAAEAPDVQQRRGLKVGYLYKQSHTAAGSWDRRFFVLSGTSLSYFRAASDYKAGVAPRATADMAGSTLVDLGSTTFDVQRLSGAIKQHSTITLRADDAQDKHDWFTALNGAASQQPEGMPRAQRAGPDLGAEGATSLVHALSSGDGVQTSRIKTDASLYVDAVRARLLACLPKAMMVALVHKAEREVSSAMYGALNQLSGQELSQLAMDDDPGALARTAALRAQLPRAKEAVALLRKALGVSKQSATPAAEAVDVPLDMLLSLRTVGVLPDGLLPFLDQSVDQPKRLDAPRRPPPPPPGGQRQSV